MSAVVLPSEASLATAFVSPPSRYTVLPIGRVCVWTGTQAGKQQARPSGKQAGRGVVRQSMLVRAVHLVSGLLHTHTLHAVVIQVRLCGLMDAQQTCSCMTTVQVAGWSQQADIAAHEGCSGMPSAELGGMKNSLML